MIYYLQMYPSIELATAYYSSEKQQVNHEEQNERLIVYLKLFSGKSRRVLLKNVWNEPVTQVWVEIRPFFEPLIRS